MMRYVWMTADYLRRMLPGILAALAVYGCLYPRRVPAAADSWPGQSRRREITLALFWMFCGGMAMLTLTPWGFDLTAVLLPGLGGTLFPTGRGESDPLSDGLPERGTVVYAAGKHPDVPAIRLFPRAAVAGIYLETRPADGGFASPGSSSAGSCWWDGPLILTICGSTPWALWRDFGCGVCWIGWLRFGMKAFHVRPI